MTTKSRAVLLSFTLLLITAFIAPQASAKSPDYESLRRFSQILDIVDQYYVEELEEQELIEGAIKGMLESLDPHSAYMTSEEFAALQETTSGEFFGIGAELSLIDGRPVVIAPIAGTPAEKAGIKSGDIIISVDGILTLDKSLDETVSKIRGEKGTSVNLLILSEGEKEPREVKIVRGVIPYTSVSSLEVEPGYLWVRLAFFNERTTDELKEALDEAKEKGPLKGIVLDMRNNPGGILDQAASVSDLFLKEGTIVSIKGRENSTRRQYLAHEQRSDILDIPVVVLINSGSASASEIVAGALSDNKRALLVGETSFGKGSVQNLIPLRDGSGIKLTIALYYTPSGKSIQAEGIEPNIEVDFLSDSGEKVTNPLSVREKDLDTHIEVEGDIATQTIKFPAPELLPLPNSITEENKAILEKDNQLRTALQLLKDMPDFTKEVAQDNSK